MTALPSLKTKTMVSSSGCSGQNHGASPHLQSIPLLSLSSQPFSLGNNKRKRRPTGTPDPDAEVIALSPKTLMESEKYMCEICNQGFQRDQNLQMHRRRHKVPWKLLKKEAPDARKRVYVCPEPTCLHHDPCHALGDLVGIKKHFHRKHNSVKQWQCEKCSKGYAVQSDYKAHLKTCGTKGHSCDCGRIFSKVESFIQHQDICFAARANASTQSSPPCPNRVRIINHPATEKFSVRMSAPSLIAGGSTPLDFGRFKSTWPLEQRKEQQFLPVIQQADVSGSTLGIYSKPAVKDTGLSSPLTYLQRGSSYVKKPNFNSLQSAETDETALTLQMPNIGPCKKRSQESINSETNTRIMNSGETILISCKHNAQQVEIENERLKDTAGKFQQQKYSIKDECRMSGLQCEEKAYAKHAREIAKREMEVAEEELGNAKRLREQAQAELIKAHILKDQVTQRIDATLLELICHTCRHQISET